METVRCYQDRLGVRLLAVGASDVRHVHCPCIENLAFKELAGKNFARDALADVSTDFHPDVRPGLKVLSALVADWSQETLLPSKFSHAFLIMGRMHAMQYMSGGTKVPWISKDLLWNLWDD